MWVNLDALKKADIAEPPKTWPEVFADARKLHATNPTCGFSTAWGSWGLIEQFSAWHNVPIGTKANGLDGFDTVLEFNTPLETKLLENLVELQKDKGFDYSGRTTPAKDVHLGRMSDVHDILGVLSERQGECEIRL